jgi:hypothetical protein
MLEKKNYLFSYVVEDTSLSAELEVPKDGEVEAVEAGEATAAGVVHVSVSWVSNVVLEPERAEGFLDAIVVSFPSSLFAFLFLALWAQHLKLILNEHDSSSLIISAL